jgi:hypothetical protein
MQIALAKIGESVLHHPIVACKAATMPFIALVEIASRTIKRCHDLELDDHLVSNVAYDFSDFIADV